uniref:receptor protein-tyrosine kinase n=1 Tax=Parascaris univalens TaxID=6257 RepID=A0A915ATJ7_PARUN
MSSFVHWTLCLLLFHIRLPQPTFSLELRECSRALGMESGRITESQLSASSSHDVESTGPQNARIRTELGSGAWCPRRQINMDTEEWLQIEFPSEVVISAVETQGRFDGGRGMEYPPAYMLEYWRSSLGSWARYKDSQHNEIIPANTDTRSAVLRVLDGGVVAQKLRIIPVSESTRTVCMRVELYGCLFKDSLLSYSMPQGSVADGLNMRDSSYDGQLNTTGFLVNGLGKLYDGVTGDDNFEKHPEKWVGWRKDIQGPTITIEFLFSEQRNISAISLYTSNFLKHHAQVFEHAHVSFSPRGDDLFSPRTVHFNYLPDTNFESSRWVRIPIHDRLAKRLRLELTMTEEAEWLLLSEVKFESGNIPFNFVYDETQEMELDQSPSGNSLTYFSVSDSSEESSRWFSAALFAVLLLLLAAVVLLFYIVCCCRRSVAVKSASPMFDKGSKDVHLMIVEGNTIKRVSPSTYRMAADNMENSLLEKLPISCDSGSEYADPDCATSPTDCSRSSAPLLTNSSVTSNVRSVHYATSDVTNLFHVYGDSASFSDTFHRNPLSSYSKYACYSIDGRHASSNLVEIDPSTLQFRERLGSGEFGEVHLCQLEHRFVAVKRLRRGASAQAESDFRQEMKVMSRLRHQNIVEVVGVCTKSEPLSCIIEHMANGDLCQYLQSQNTLSREMLLSICTQVAAGMSYLESQHFVHRDLAARNCLVAEDGTVKIGDFGMARSLYDSDYYKIEGAFVLPIRWMAWECLLLGKFTSKTDVWSFGVTMWEILNGCSCQPFFELQDEQVIENIQHIYQHGQLKVYLEKPQYCNVAVYNQLLMPCWGRDDHLRPSFQTLHRHLQNLLCSQYGDMARDFV